jgi:hypothetical protein
MTLIHRESRRLLAIAAALVLVAVSSEGAQSSGTSQPTATPPTLVVRRPDSVYTGPIDSFLRTDPFQIEVKSPGSGPTITIDFSTGQGVHQTLTLVETGPGSGIYLSQVITPKDGAQKTGEIEKRLPGNLSQAMKGFGTEDGDPVTVSFNGASNTFRVYDTNVTQAVGRHDQAFTAIRHQMSDARVAAQTLLKRPKLPPATVKKLNDVVAIADGRLKLLSEMDNILAHPAARQGAGDDVGTLYWKLRTQIAYLNLVRQPDPRTIDPATRYDIQRMALNIVEKVKSDSATAIPTAFALGIYNAAASTVMATPVLGIFGKNAYGGKATPEEIEAAATGLISMVLMAKVMPAVIDSAAGSVANELSGLGNRASTPLAAPLASGPSGYQPRELPKGFNAAVNDSVFNQGISDITVRGAKAIAAGVPAPAVNTLVEETIANARQLWKGANLDGAMLELNKADLQLAEQHFNLEHPGATLVDNPDDLAVIRSVRTKAALESGVPPKPQRWTPAEAAKLQELNTNPSLKGAFELEDPTDPVFARDFADREAVEPGYQRLLTAEDSANIAKVAAKGNLIIAENVAGAGPRSRLSLFNDPQAAPANQAGATGQAVQPGGAPNTSNPPRAAGPIQSEFSLDKLRAEIAQKQQIAAARASLKRASPVSGTRVATGAGTAETGLRPMETDVIKPESIKALTPAEISRFTPEDIKGLPPAMRDQLPLNQLSARQLQAVADAGTVLTDDRIRSLTPDTIRRLPPELRDLVKVDPLTRDQLRALADATGIPTPASAWLPAVPTAGAPTNTAGGAPAASTLGLSPGSQPITSATTIAGSRDEQMREQLSNSAVYDSKYKDHQEITDYRTLKFFRNPDGSMTLQAPNRTYRAHFDANGLQVEDLGPTPASNTAGTPGAPAAAGAAAPNAPAAAAGGSVAPVDSSAATAGTAAGGTFEPAGTYADPYDYGSDADEYTGTKISDLIQERKEDPNDYGPETKEPDGSVSRTSKDGKTKVSARARNGKITVRRFTLKADAAAQPAANSTGGSAAPPVVSGAGELKDALIKAGADPGTLTANEEGTTAYGRSTDRTATFTADRRSDGSFTLSKRVAAGDAEQGRMLQAMNRAIVAKGGNPSDYHTRWESDGSGVSAYDSVNDSSSSIYVTWTGTGVEVSDRLKSPKASSGAAGGGGSSVGSGAAAVTPGTNTAGGGAAPAPGGGNTMPGGSGGAAVVGKTFAASPAPACKRADGDCDALRQAARASQAEADKAARALPFAQNDLAAADAADRDAAANHDQADKTYATAAGFSQLGDKARADALTATAREFDAKGTAASARAQALRDQAAATKASAEQTAAAAAAAWSAYTGCMKLPPCPDDTTSAAPGPVNMMPGAPAGLGEDTGSVCGTGDCVPQANCVGDCIDMARGCEADGTCQKIVDLIHQLMVSAVSAAMGSFSASNDSGSRALPGALRAVPRALAALVRAGNPFASRSRPIDLAPGTMVMLEPRPHARAVRSAEPSATLVSTGSSTGDAFRLRITDPSGRTRKISMPEGLVLQPIKQPNSAASAPPAAAQPAGASRATAIGAFCLEFAKLPPSAGMLYQVAPQALQQKFKSLQSVLQAATRLQQMGGLHPDSNPKTYADSIKQYALWTRIGHWDAKTFEDSFVELTKKNVAALKQNWTQAMETTIRGAAPGRWRDVQAVLQQADALAARPAR